MIVAALLEFAVVLLIKHRSTKMSHQGCRSEKQEGIDDRNAELQIENYSRSDGQSNTKKEAWMKSNKSSTSEKPRHEMIDRACFGIFPILYLVFNVIYWASYSTI